MLFKKITTFSVIAIIFINLIEIFHNNTYANFDSNSSTTHRANIAVLLYTFDDAFMLNLKNQLENIESQNKDKVHFTFYDGKNNIATQLETLDSILKSDIDLIIGNLVDTREQFVESIVLKVKQKNIPIILLNIDPDVRSKVSKEYKNVTFLGPDSKIAGMMQGKAIVNLWNTDRKALDKNNDNILQYILLQGEKLSPITINRSKYSISTINDSGIQTQELALANANWLREFAKDAVDNLFLKYNKNIEAIISNNDAMAIGAIESLQNYGYNKGDKSKNIAVFGIDGLPESKDLIEKGFMTSTLEQDPKIVAEELYSVGMNLVNNLDPLLNTNYNIVNGEILIPFPYNEYVKKSPQ